MLTIGLDWTKPRLGHVLCLGAHCDDIEIGCSGSIARLVDEHPGLTVTWVVFCSNDLRAREARASVESLLAGVKTKDIVIKTFRDGFLEYEIPKFDGDLGSPNVFVHLDETQCRRKIDNILRSFRSQGERSWFSEETFRAILRLRGVESNAPGGYAEAFYSRKLVLG